MAWQNGACGANGLLALIHAEEVFKKEKERAARELILTAEAKPRIHSIVIDKIVQVYASYLKRTLQLPFVFLQMR